MKMNKALLIVEPTTKAMSRFASILKRGKITKHKGYMILSFPSYATLGKVITGARLELLAAIRNQKPDSIQELARFVDRDFKNVYTDVKLLFEYGLIELKEQGARKSSLPIALYSEFLIAA